MAGGLHSRWVFVATMLAVIGRPAAAAEDRAAGKKLYTAKCARCHQFYDPVKYSDDTWKTWMEKMRRKANLNDDQYKRLSDYLQSVRSQARSPLNTNPKP
jgi:mono/diheme cytochrome c family protein